MSQLHNIEVQFIVLMFTQLSNSSCLPSQASLSVCVTNLLVVDVSLISSAFNVTAQWLPFTLVTHVELVKNPLSFVKFITLPSGSHDHVPLPAGAKNVSLTKSYIHNTQSLSLCAGIKCATSVQSSLYHSK